MRRHFQIELVDSAFPAYPACEDAAQRARAFGVFERVAGEYLTPSIEQTLSPYGRAALRFVRRGDEEGFRTQVAAMNESAAASGGRGGQIVVEGDRVYVALPGFRTGAEGLDDDVFEVGSRLKVDCRLERVLVEPEGVRIAAECRLGDLTGDVDAVELVLRPTGDGRPDVTIPLGFRIEHEIVRDRERPFVDVLDTIDPALLPGACRAGSYHLHIRLRANGVARMRSLVECAPPPRSRRIARGGGAHCAFYTRKSGGLSIVARRGAAPAMRARLRARLGR